MDTTWRDAHQSLLATRMRTVDMANIAKETSHALQNAYSLECWGGATFDVAMRFLYEDPWDRLVSNRHVSLPMAEADEQAVANTASARAEHPSAGTGSWSQRRWVHFLPVSLSSIWSINGEDQGSDNAIYEFSKKAVEAGLDIFRVFESVCTGLCWIVLTVCSSLNYFDNLKLGIDAAKKAGGVVEGTICYSGDVANPKRTKYTLQYYLDLTDQLVNEGIHVLGLKDMAGLLKPEAAKM